MKFEGREHIIHKQLAISHMSGNRPLPNNDTELQFMVKNWSELLKSIPDGDLVKSFANAIISSKYTASVADVIAGYSTVKSGEFNKNDWQTSKPGTFKPDNITAAEVQFSTRLIIKYPQFREVLTRMSTGNQNLPPDRQDHVECCRLVSGMFDGR